MSLDNTKIVDLNIKKDERVLDFNDFQKQGIKFDIDSFLFDPSIKNIGKIKSFGLSVFS